MNLVEKNRENLLAMWRLVNKNMNVYKEDVEVEYGALEYSKWPNRIWSNKVLTKEEVAKMKTILLKEKTSMVIPCWDLPNQETYKLLETAGFAQRMSQVGMSLKLKKPNQPVEGIKFTKVVDQEKAELWSTLFYKAFNYKIATGIIVDNLKDLDFLIAYKEGVPVGTVLLYIHDEKVMGIHCMGVIPEHRRKGYAELMMTNVLHIAYVKDAKYCVLQASNAGKGLYLKLGFKEQFIVRTYGLDS